MKRKKNVIVTISICSIIVFLVFVMLNIEVGLHSTKNITKVGVIDSYIPKDVLDKRGITSINLTQNYKENVNNHGKVTLKLIQDECKYEEFYYASVLDEENTASVKNVISAIEWCINQNVDIICMSFATFDDDPKLEAIINKAVENDIIIVAACVNFSNIDCYPAMYKNVISVSEGSNPNATVTIKNKVFKINIDGVNLEKRGTSVLTAYVTGCISREISKENYNIDKVIERVKKI